MQLLMKLLLPLVVSFAHVSPRSGPPIRRLSSTSCNKRGPVERRCARWSHYALPPLPPRCETVPSVDRHALKSSLLPRHTYYLWGNTVIRSGQIPKQNKPQMRSGRIQKRTYIHTIWSPHPYQVHIDFVCIYPWYIHLYVCACTHAYLPYIPTR